MKTILKGRSPALSSTIRFDEIEERSSLINYSDIDNE